MFPSITTIVPGTQPDDTPMQPPTKKRKKRNPVWDKAYEQKRKLLGSRGHPVNLTKGQKTFLEPHLFQDIKEWLICQENQTMEDMKQAGEIEGFQWEALDTKLVDCYAGSVDCMLRILLMMQPKWKPKAAVGEYGRGGYFVFTKQALREAQNQQLNRPGVGPDRHTTTSTSRSTAFDTKNDKNTTTSVHDELPRNPSTPMSISPVSMAPHDNHPTSPSVSTPPPSSGSSKFRSIAPSLTTTPIPPLLHPSSTPLTPTRLTIAKNRKKNAWRVWFYPQVFSRLRYCKSKLAPPETTNPDLIEMLLGLVRYGGCKWNPSTKRLEDVGLEMKWLEWRETPYQRLELNGGGGGEGLVKMKKRMRASGTTGSEEPDDGEYTDDTVDYSEDDGGELDDSVQTNITKPASTLVGTARVPTAAIISKPKYTPFGVVSSASLSPISTSDSSSHQPQYSKLTTAPPPPPPAARHILINNNVTYTPGPSFKSR
ncbi:hypothetical protein HDV05_000579 [Chytridiales sp. JEL 0842]|nr:hypothetical protein HDV05_000579 [Chytridiales sp. JEL 0842]